jgi:hypothetical protein
MPLDDLNVLVNVVTHRDRLFLQELTERLLKGSFRVSGVVLCGLVRRDTEAELDLGFPQDLSLLVLATTDRPRCFGLDLVKHSASHISAVLQLAKVPLVRILLV